MNPIELTLSSARELRLLGAATPTNAREERARLSRALGPPRWVYSAHDPAPILERLARARAAADGEHAELLRERIDELLLECELVRAIGTPRLDRLARARFPLDPRATQAARAMVARPREETRAPLIRTNEARPESLLSLMREAVRERALPFEVKVSATLTALAATGDGAIFVAADRAITARAAHRTVHHEIFGHALPRHRARARHPLFLLGTAGGHDDQEGFALVLEERAGFLDAERGFELGARHLAAAWMRDGADFVEVARGVRELGAPLERAIATAERVFRGSHGALPGLGREVVYLSALARAKEHLARFPGDERVLGAGQLSLSSVRALLSSSPMAPFGGEAA